MILAIDCGLSAVKLSVAALDGEVLATERAPYPTVRARGVAEQDPADWWKATAAAAARLPHRREIAVIVPTGHMHGLVLVDRRQEPLLPCLTLHDRRGAGELERFDPDAFRQLTGEILDANLPLAKLLWLSRTNPTLLDAATAVLAPKDYLQVRLTGRVVTESVDAAGTGLYNPTTGRWLVELLDQTALPARLLPTVLPSTELAPILPDAATELGLRPSTLVAVGAGDDVELLGATGHRPADAVEHVGTTGGILRALARGERRLPGPGVELYPTASPGRFAVGVSTTHAGAVFDWVRDRLGVVAAEVLDRDPVGGDPIATVGLFAERSDGAGTGRGGATIHGLSEEHDRVDLARSLVIGATLVMRGLLEEIEDATGSVETIFTSGSAGGPAWTRWRAAAYRRPVAVLQDDPTARGCVAIGLCAYAGLADPESVAGDLPAAYTIVEPDPELAAIVERISVAQSMAAAAAIPGVRD